MSISPWPIIMTSLSHCKRMRRHRLTVEISVGCPGYCCTDRASNKTPSGACIACESPWMPLKQIEVSTMFKFVSIFITGTNHSSSPCRNLEYHIWDQAFDKDLNRFDTHLGISPVTNAVQDRVAHRGECGSGEFRSVWPLSPERLADIRHLVVSLCAQRVAKEVSGYGTHTSLLVCLQPIRIWLIQKRLVSKLMIQSKTR